MIPAPRIIVRTGKPMYLGIDIEHDGKTYEATVAFDKERDNIQPVVQKLFDAYHSFLNDVWQKK